MSADTSELDALARDLAGAGRRAGAQARKVMKRGALGVKTAMKEEFSGHGHAPWVPGSLEFEATGDADGLSYRIGELDSAGPQWGIAAILAFGTSNNAPVVDHTKALHGEAEKVAHYLGEAGENAVLGGPR